MNLAKSPSCAGCVLANAGKAFSKPYGTCVNGVLIVGDDLEESDVREGFPFNPAAPSGHVLERVLSSLSLDRKQFGLWNIIACVPPYANAHAWEYPAIEHCKRHFHNVMEMFKPKVIVACGTRATRVLTHLTGKKMRVEDIQGFALAAPEYPGVRVIPTYSPWQIQKGQWQCFPILRLAIAKAVRLAQEGWKAPDFAFSMEATTQELTELAEYLEANPTVDLNVDFETDGGRLELPPDPDEENEEEEEEVETKGAISTEARITQVNFAVEEDAGYAVTYRPEVKPVVQRIFDTQNPKNGHNFWLYDDPVATYNGLCVKGVVYDTLWMFHHLYPDLPGSYKKQADDTKKDQGSMASLQYCASFYGAPFPWKHLRLEQSGFYGCLDAANGLRVFNGVREDMQQMGVWESYLLFVQRLRPILADAERRGIPVNREKLQKFIAMLTIKEQERLAALRPLIPIALRPAKQTNGLKRVPKDTTGLVQRVFDLEEPEQCNCVKKTRATKCKACQGTKITCDASGDVTDCATCGSTGMMPPTATADPTCSLCEGKGVISGKVTRWCALKDFNPNSHVQMKEYAAYRMHRIPMNSKRKYAMDKETLERLHKNTKDPVYKITMDAKSIKKMKGTYGEGWLKRLGNDDAMHTQFLFLPATGQLSSTNCNVQNTPHPMKGPPLQRQFATEFRDAIEAKPGYVLIELDYKSYHACTLAWEAKDWDYLRLAKLDIHSYLAGQMLRVEGYRQALGWDDEKLGAWLKGIKRQHEKVRNEQAKPCIAEGQMVLTDKGLVPIEFVTLAHKVWDGVEWVSHEGVICKGVKEVMTYDGLTATPDHEIVTESGQAKTLREAKSVLDRLERTGDGRLSVRTLHSNIRHPKTHKRLHLLPVSLCVRSRVMGKPWQSSRSKDKRVYEVRSQITHSSQYDRSCFGVSLRADERTMQQSKMQGVQGLWGAWNTGSHDSIRVFAVCENNVPKKFIQRGSDRSQGQRRSLRNKQHSIGHTQAANEKSTQNYEIDVSWRTDNLVRLQEPLLSELHVAIGDSQKDDGRADTSKTRKSKVYDIINAGPRHRFTVSNVLVFNCILGYGFGMGASRLYRTNPDNFRSLSEAQGVFSALSSAFPRAAAYREDSPEQAHKAKFLKSAFDCIRWFWNVKTYDFQRHEWTHGQDWDKAIAFRPANDAFCQKKIALLRCEEKGYTQRYGFANDLHDAFFFHCPEKYAEECIHNVKYEMELPSEVMKMPNGSGFTCEVDVKMGKTWARMEEYKG